jgi:hypothetical protein
LQVGSDEFAKLQTSYWLENKKEFYRVAGSGFLKAAYEGEKKKPGRPRGPAKTTQRNVRAAQRMFQQYAEEAMLVMVEIMRDPDADHAVRLKAANDIQNRAYGTPVSTQVQHKIIEGESESAVNSNAISQSATKELEQLAAVLARFVEQEKNTIEVNPKMPDDYPG